MLTCFNISIEGLDLNEWPIRPFLQIVPESLLEIYGGKTLLYQSHDNIYVQYRQYDKEQLALTVHIHKSPLSSSISISSHRCETYEA